MSIFSRLFMVIGLLLAIQSSAPAQTPPPSSATPPAGLPSTSPGIPPSPAPAPPPEWAIASAPARFIIDLDDVTKPAPISSVNLCLPNPDWLGLPIRVFTDTGTAVGSDILWSAPGDPATLLFDSSSGAKRYKVYLASNWPVQHLDNAKSGVMLESRAGDGASIEHLADMQAAWNKSTAILGRAMVPGIYEGGHRFGPQGNILEHLQGWFDVDKQEHLQLATISTDASFVLVDGNQVVAWPGRHDHNGQVIGDVDLTAGPHLIDYYNAYVSANAGQPLLACLAAKGGAYAQWTMLNADSGFFHATARAHIVNYELQTAGAPGSSVGIAAPAFAIDWGVNGQSVIDPMITNIGLITMRLTCRTPIPGATVTWTFDDGTTAQGQNVKHLFPRPGMRVVQVSVKDGDKPLGTLSQTVSVHPNWTQLGAQHPDLNTGQLSELMERDPAGMPASDLAGCVAVFGIYKNSDGLLKILPAVCAKMKDVNEPDLPYMKDAAVFLARENLTHDADAARMLTALVDRCTQDKPSQHLLTIGSQSRLELAQLTLKTTDHTDAVRALLDGVSVPTLSGDEHRLYDLLHADLALATGDVAGAKKQYETLTGDPSGPDARSSIRRTARISQARAFIDRKDFDAADRTLNEVAWQTPIEKLSPEWALTRLRLYQEQNLPLIAYLWAKRLLPVLIDDSRSELLFRITDLAFAQGDNNLAQKTLTELLNKHPYSQEAAEAKQKWPAK